MAIDTKMAWVVRTDGSDSNGGGFKRGGTGTDYSNQAAAQFSGTDLVIDGAVNTKVTSATHNFVSTDVGNLIQVTAGSGFTTGFYEIVSVASNAATLDRAVGTVGSTGGTWAEGGSLLTLGKNLTSLVTGNKTHVRQGTYTLTSGLSTPGSIENLMWEGFGTSPEDGGTRPLITTATNSTRLVTHGDRLTRQRWKNINFSNTAGTRAEGFYANTNGKGPVLILEDAILDGFSVGIKGDYSGDYYWMPLTLRNVEIKNCTSHAMFVDGSIWAIDCYFHDNTGDGLHGDGAGEDFQLWHFERCRFIDNAYGIQMTSQPRTSLLACINNVFHSNTNSGVKLTYAVTTIQLVWINNIATDNGAYGIDVSTADSTNIQIVQNRNNSYRGNSTAARNNLPAGTNDVTITGDPYTSSGGSDFTLNNTAGAGAALRAAGYPTNVDIGYAQHTDSGGGGSGRHRIIGGGIV